MSVQQIFEALERALQSDQIALSAQTVAGIDLTLTAIGVPASGALQLTRAELALDERAVVLTGITEYREFEWAATLTGESVETGNRFTLVLRGLDNEHSWRFETSFASLPQSRRMGDSGATVLTSSVLAPLLVEQPMLSVTTEPDTLPPVPSPRFQGWLKVSESDLSIYAVYLAAPRLRIDGIIDFTVLGSPRLELRAVAPAVDRQLAPIDVSEVGLLLSTTYRDLLSMPPGEQTSAAALYLRFQIGAGVVRGQLSAPLLQGDVVWPLGVTFDSPITLPGAMAALLEFFGETDRNLFSFPLLNVFNEFGLSAVEVGVIPPASVTDSVSALPERTTSPPAQAGTAIARLSHAMLAFESTKEWDPPIPFVKVRSVGTSWVYRFGSEIVTGDVWGHLRFYDGGARKRNPVDLMLRATIPEFEITAETTESIDIPLGEWLEEMLGGGANLPALTISRALISAAPRSQTYQAAIVIGGKWELPVSGIVFALEGISARVEATQSKIVGQISAVLSINVPGTADKATFRVSAAYLQTGAWRFEGGLADGTLKLVELVKALLGLRGHTGALPLDIDIVELWLSYEASGSVNPYSVRGKLNARWSPVILGLPLSLSVRASLSRRAKTSAADELRALALPELVDGEAIYEGEVSGTFQVNRLEVIAGLSFAESSSVWMFEVTWEGAGVRAATEWVTDSPTKKHEVLAISPRGVTLGQLVRRLAKLVNPNLNFQLDAPWSVLDTIDLSRFALVVDPTNKSVRLRYDVRLELVFMNIKTVALVYDRSSGEPSVRFELTGKMLGKEYPASKPLSWDALSQRPPEVPGQGKRLFELRYLGMGQRVALSGLARYVSIREVLRELQREMQPVSKPNTNPLGSGQPGQLLRFDESSEWMLGLSCRVMETVSLQLVLHDPDLYGLLVGLEGTRAGSLKGLELELSYRKVSDSVGVFRASLQVPVQFRQLDFGPVAITLGVITVEVFTNANFKVDLGFPRNRNFSASFGLQAGPFIGSGGIYLGVLNGTTSSRVPAVINGSFAPVIELGLGLQAGIGRRVEKGALKGELSLQAVAIFEGVLAWFNPTNASAGSSMYYWAQTTAGITGKLYGAIDFKVIRASFSLEAHAYVIATLAAYRKLALELDVGVTVNAEAEVCWISVSFHFSLTLKESMTIGSDSTPPWTLAPGQSGRSQQRLLENVSVPRRRDPELMRALTRGHLRGPGAPGAREGEPGTGDPGEGTPGYRLNWRTDIHVFPDGLAHAATVKMLPAFTVDAVPVRWPDQGEPGGSQEYRVAFLLMLDSGAQPGAETVAQARDHSTRTSVTAVGELDTSLNVTIEAMLRWALSALGLDPVAGSVTAGQLEELAEQLELPETFDAGFALSAKLAPFFTNNLTFTVSGLPEGPLPPRESGGSAFPIPPPLGWNVGDPRPQEGCERLFSTYQPIDATYQAELAEYFAELDPRPQRPVPAAVHARDGGEDTVESMAGFVFRDYFLLLTRTAVAAALELIAAFPYTVTGAAGESLASICALFGTAAVPYVKCAGDTVDQVAHHFGLSESEALALNPNLKAELHATPVGGTITVKLGATPEGLAAANPGWQLKPGLALQLGTLSHLIAASETLAGIAGRLGADIEAWLQTSELLEDPRLLREGARLPLPASSYANGTGLSLVLVAALLYVRLHAGQDFHLSNEGVPLVEWYASAIASLNEVQEGKPLPATLRVPVGYDNTSELVTWTTLPGDTLWRVAAYFAFAQNPGDAESGYRAWLLSLEALNPGPDPHAQVQVPTSETSVLAGETLAELQARLPLEEPGLNRQAFFRKIVKNAPILAELARVNVPGATATTEAGQTLQSLAEHYDLPLEESGRRLAGVSQLLAVSKQALRVPHPGSVPIGAASETPADLVPAVLRERGADIGGQATRYLLHGLRAPAPELGADGRYHATGPLTGLYELAGQQLVSPPPPAEPPPPEPPPEPRLIVGVRLCEAAPWIELSDSLTLADEQPLAPELAARNPGLALRESRAGLVALTGPTEELVFTITDADLWLWCPANELSPAFLAGPEPLTLHREVQVRHTLAQRVLWQTTENLHLPNPAGTTAPAVGSPTLWPFSGDLLGAAGAFPDADFTLNRLDAQLGPQAPPRALSRFAWASMVQVRIRRTAGLPDGCELLGADGEDRDTLLALWRYLAADDEETAAVHLLWQAQPTAGLVRGLASTEIDQAGTYLIKANLSTETHSDGVLGFARAEGIDPFAGPYYARPQDAQRFLTLVWECSIVGGGGYWLRYLGAGGGPLPESIFAADGGATLTLLVLLGSQCTSSPPSRTLLACNNCAVVGESLDASADQLFAAVADAGETQREATVQPGNVGFSVELRKPPPTPGRREPQLALQRLYSLLGYQLLAGGGFQASRPALPAPPQLGQGVAGGEADEQVWSIFQVLPVHRFAASHPLPAVTGLPDPEADPYAGVDSAGGSPDPTLAHAQVALNFRDLLGNASLGEGDTASGGPDLLDLPVGYTDALVALSAWPASTLSFGVGASDAEAVGAELWVSVAFQAAGHLPGARQRGSGATPAAASDNERYERIYFQIMQRDVSAALLSSLEVSTDGEPAPQALDPAPLRWLAQGACAWTWSAAQLADSYPDTTLDTTLEALSARHGVGLEALAAANAEVPLERMFVPPPAQPVDAHDLTIPLYAVFRDGGAAFEYTADPEVVLTDPENVALPLRPGIELAVPGGPVVVPPDPPSPQPPPTLAQLAEGFGVSSASLARANAAEHGLLRAGTVLVCNGVEIEISAEHPDVSLEDVAETLTEEGVPLDATMVACENAEVPGLFRAGVTLIVDRYTVRDGDSLTANGSGVQAKELARLNARTVDLYAAGTALYVSYQSATGVLAWPLARVAETYGLAPEQLLRHNRSVALVAPAPTPADPLWLAVPGEAALPPVPAALRVPYAIPEGATLAGVAALFVDADPGAASAALALAEANSALPGTLAAEQPVEVSGQRVLTQEGDSLDSLCARFSPTVTLAEVVAYIAERDDYLATGALLLCPPALLGRSTTLYTPQQVARRYGVGVEELTAANLALGGLVAPGVQLSLPAPPDGQQAHIVTGAADTLGSLAWRFAQLHVQATPAQIVAANSETAFLQAEATLLLGPATTVLSAVVGAGGWHFPGPIFPLQVSVEIARAPQLLAPGFTDASGPVARSRSPVAPFTTPGEDGALALTAFAAELEASVPELRATTGTVSSEQGAVAPADVWALAFGAELIESLQVWPGTTIGDTEAPRYYALRPLAPALVSRQAVPIAPLEPDGTLGLEVATDFQGIDMETWAQRVLADVELFCSAPYATAAYRSSRRACLERVLAAKQTLAGAIADGLDYVLDLGSEDPDPPEPARVDPPPADWAAARESLLQRLLVDLLDGYGTDAIVQYDSNASTPDGLQARLSGPGTLATGQTPSEEERRTSLSSAKTSLVDGDGYVDFLLDVSREGEQRSVELELGYPLNELELGIEAIVEGYESSDWLAFVRPFTANLPSEVQMELGSPNVPLALRGYPSLPTLLGQSFEATTKRPGDYEQALHWDYACSFQHQAAAPDQLRVEVEFNAPSRSGTAAGTVDDLFAKLAQYTAVAPELWAILEALPGSGGGQEPRVENAIETLADLLESVATAWSTYWSGDLTGAHERGADIPMPPPPPPVGNSPAGAPGPAKYAFAAALEPVWNAAAGKWYWSKLVLTRTHADGELGWPVMAWFHPDGPVESMGAGAECPGGRCYEFPAGKVEAYQPLGFELRMGGLHVAEYQSATARVQVVRNAQLLQGGPPTRESFVYRTPTLSFASPVAPLLSWEQPFAIGAWHDAPAENPLPAVFDAIFDQRPVERSIACEIRYGYELAGAGQEQMVSHLPVAFHPQYEYGETSVQQILETVIGWRTAMAPATAGGEWVFALYMFSSVDRGSDRPLLELKRLYSPASA